VREFSAVIDRATILGNGRCLAIDQAVGFESAVPGTPATLQTDTTLPTAGHAPRPDQGNGFPTHDQAVKEHIERALARSRGRIEGRRGAASLLDLNPHTLRGKMRKLGIDWRRYRDSDA
jgi:hydrogenase-4 transcriptional activator